MSMSGWVNRSRGMSMPRLIQFAQQWSFGIVTPEGRSMFLRSGRLISRGWVLAWPNFLGNPYLRPHLLTKNDQTWWGEKHMQRIVFQVSYIPSTTGQPSLNQFLGFPTYANPLWSTTTIFGMVNTYGEGRVIRGPPCYCTVHKCIAWFVSNSRISCTKLQTHKAKLS